MVGTKEKIALLRSGKQSAEAHVHEILDNIRKSNKKINAILFINGDALQQARTIDHKLKAGKPLGKSSYLDGFIELCEP